MFFRLFRFLSPHHVPAMCRPSYTRELVTSATLPVGISMVEGAVVGVMAAKIFGASEAQVATITAAGMFANLTSLLWARLTRGLRKIPSIAAMTAGVAACVAAIAALPTTGWGASALVALVIVSRCLIVGMITVRSTVWRQNYPRNLRGRITGNLALMVNTLLFAAPMAAGLVLDAHPQGFRWIYLLSAAVSLMGVASFLGIRLRGEPALLEFERSPGVTPTRHGDVVGIYEYDQRQAEPRVGMFAVLMRDRLFRRYMLWQFFAGVSNMMVEPVLIYMAAKETQSLAGGFFLGLMLTHGIPTLLMVLTLPLWARRLDAIQIAQFRVEQAWLWTASQLIIWIGAVWAGPTWWTIGMLGLGRFVLGIARGAGTLAWNLGHNDFASREMVTVYMGIHVTLTGVRGAFAPFMGMMLFGGWAADGWFARHIGPCPGLGGHVFFLSAILSAISLWGFWTLKHQLHRSGRTMVED